MNVKILTLIALILILISGCNGTYQAYYQTLKIAFAEQNDVKLTLIEVQQSDIDVMSVKRGKRPAAIMALAYLENNQHKWVSIDNTMLIMEKGRIIRTVGLNKNLLHSSNSALDPLKSLLHLPSPKFEPQPQTWSRSVDLTGDEYGHAIESIFSLASPDTIQTLGLNIEAILYVETLDYKAPADYLRFNNSWQNFFWFTKSGELIKSIQKVSPLSEFLEITYLSRIARLSQ
ncbi:MAG: hypothetical protein ACI9LE_002204 [Paraglaciecola sp.]|jgi:hypothetical protein